MSGGKRGRGATGRDAREQALLAAGAVLEASAGGAGDDTDVLTARGYRHPALDDRTVVRLVPETLGAAEDLALEYLGFERGSLESGRGEPAAVGRVLRQSLGFPAWALVNDPANGHHALAVVKEMERLARLVTAKPGHAKDGFDEIGQRLDRSVPHFLPTYYEQVARLFLAAESRQQASAFFGKARAAEQRHALAVDEERLREVFLEFAAAGALSGKALREHARGLTVRLSPAAAFEQFRTLCLERCAAGLTPYAGMLEDLRRLAKSAGENAAAQERAVLSEVLSTGSVVRAAASFWKAARAAVIDVARTDAAVRERLLGIFPAAGGDRPEEFDASWLSLLDACGAVDLLLDGTAPAAGWLDGWARHRQRGWGWSGRVAGEQELVGRLAARLTADGQPVRLFGGGWRSHCDLDLLDACLSHGVPVADPPHRAQLPLGPWLNDSAAGRRELSSVAADPRFASLLRAAVEQLAGESDGPARLLDLVGQPVLGPVVADWLRGLADELEQPFGLPGLEQQLGRLARFSAPAVLATAPDAVERIERTDPAPALARTLRGGIFDELGWAALDRALERFGKVSPPSPGQWRPTHNWYRLHDAWPALIVRLDTHVVAVGPDAILEERTLTLPAPSTRGWDEPTVRYVDGQWLIASGSGDERRASWSGRPTELFRPTGELDDGWRPLTTASLALPDGGRCFGARPVYPGDTTFAARRPLACDGISYWVQHEGSWHEYDPLTARRGRQSVPAFFDGALADQDGGRLRLVQGSSRLLPVQPGLESSPLGSKDGLLGWWVRRDERAGTLTACSVDGSRSPAIPLPVGADLRYGTHTMPLPPLRLPGGATLDPREEGNPVRLYDADGVWLGTVHTGDPGNTYAAGHRVVPPLWYWHALRPRDEAGSARLRDVTTEDAAALLKAVADGAAPAEAVARMLPQITHHALAKGVASVVAEAARGAKRLAQFREKAQRKIKTPRPVTVRHARDGALADALAGLLGGGHSYGYARRGDQATTAMDQVRALVRLTSEPAPPADGSGTLVRTVQLSGTGVGWLYLLGEGMAAVAARAAAPGTTPENREALLEFLEAALGRAAVDDAVLADPRGRLRTLELCEPMSAAKDRTGQIHRAGDRQLLILGGQRVHDDRRHWTGVEFDPAGAFGPWEGHDLKDSEVVGGAQDPSRAAALRRTVALVREHGPLPYRPEQAAGLADATGLDQAAAALLLLGLPGVNGYGRDGVPAPEVLEMCGIGSARFQLGRDLISPLLPAQRRRVLARLAPATPAEAEAAWQRGIDLEPLTSDWLSAYGRRRSIPAELLARAKRESVGPNLISSVLDPERRSELTGRTTQRITDGWLTPAEPAELLRGTDISGYVYGLRWLAYRLPYGDPLRAALPRTLEMLRARLADPGLLLDVGADWTVDGTPTAARIREAYGLPETGGADQDGLVAAGPALVLTPMRYGANESVWLRPHAVLPQAGPEGGPDHPALALLAGVARPSQSLRALRDVLSEEFAALVRAQGPEGASQHPAHSCPELVAEAAERFGCSQDAATLYLMLLALPDPTDRNQASWTGWKPARLKTARTGLVTAGLVVEAKRARAGRSLFLPGGWQECRSPQLPQETWKQPLFTGDRGGFTVPYCPVPELFARAWRRVVDGDAPGYEEFTGRRGGRGSRGGAR